MGKCKNRVTKIQDFLNYVNRGIYVSRGDIYVSRSGIYVSRGDIYVNRDILDADAVTDRANDMLQISSVPSTHVAFGKYKTAVAVAFLSSHSGFGNAFVICTAKSYRVIYADHTSADHTSFPAKSSSTEVSIFSIVPSSQAAATCGSSGSLATLLIL